MRRGPGIALGVMAGLVLAGVLAMGWAWHADRARRWETPALGDPSLVRLRAGQRDVQGGQATWMVAVHPRCPRCLQGLRVLAAERAARARPERLIALIVDTPARPGAASLRLLPAVPVWWDRDGIWRRRWGHRLYGEVLRFDAGERYLGTIAASEAMRSIRTNAPW